MKKLFLITIILSLALPGLTQNNAPVAVDDTIPGVLNPGDTFTFNAINNDYDPDGDYFYIWAGGDNFTDSTITIEIPLTTLSTGWYKIAYLLKDEFGLLDTCSSAHLHYQLENKSYDFLDVNNISALFNAYGNHFWDFEEAHYHFPKDSITNTLFNCTFWLGGLDENDNLLLAAEKYRQSGTDYQTGPLSYNNDSAWITDNTIQNYYKIWKLNKTEVEYHVMNWNEPGYEPIENIANWPAHGDVALHQNFYLAPFVDMNNNGEYEPLSGDYPLIRGDQSLFFIFNDQKTHTETGGETIGVEIHGFAYAFNAPDNPSLNNTTFLSYKIFNRSQQTLTDAYAGILTDFDLGEASDDYVGCDISRGAYYGYNGKETDGEGGPGTYGNFPPAQGVVILGGPYMDADGIDNPDDECDESINGVGFGDGVEDNERFGMSSFVYFSNWQGPTGDPEMDIEYYNYMKAIWKDNTPMFYGGTGHEAGGAYGPEAKFAFPGLSDPCNWGTGGAVPNGPIDWSEISEDNEPGDRRGLCSMGPFTLEPEAFHKVDIAFVTGQGDDYLHSVDVLKEAIDSVKSYYYNDPDHFGYAWMGTDENLESGQRLSVYPNPADDMIQIRYQPKSNKANYIIYDSYGREAKTGTLERQANIQSISLDNLPKGLYILQVNDNTIFQSEKILIK